MKVTRQEIKAKIHGWDCVIPKGTPVSHQTACGYDESYNFVTNEYKWGPINPLTNKIAGTWLHDMKYRGYHISNDLLEEID